MPQVHPRPMMGRPASWWEPENARKHVRALASSSDSHNRRLLRRSGQRSCTARTVSQCTVTSLRCPRILHKYCPAIEHASPDTPASSAASRAAACAVLLSWRSTAPCRGWIV